MVAWRLLFRYPLRIEDLSVSRFSIKTIFKRLGSTYLGIIQNCPFHFKVEKKYVGIWKGFVWTMRA